MPSLKLSNPFRRGADRPTLRKRAADLKSSLSHLGGDQRPAAEASPSRAETGDDAELLHLGQQFEAARQREIAACEACNAAQAEADRHMPERPAALYFRASDHPLRLRKFLTHPDTLDGEKVTSDDIAWMQRKPYVREVRRPVRPEDNLPPDARTVIDTSPWPEAQDRADEIVTAWEAWHAERLRIHGEYVTAALDEAANEAGDAAAAFAGRIAILPAHTAAGFRVKLRALLHYRRDTLLTEIPDEPDPDQLLSHSLWREAQKILPAPTPANVLTTAILDLWRDWAAKEEAEAYDEAMQQRRFGLIGAAEALPATAENISVKALALSWLEYVDHWRPGSERRSYSTDGRLAIDIHAAASQTPAAAPVVPHEPNLVGMLDLASATIDELQNIRDLADAVGGVAYAYTWGPRCGTSTGRYGATEPNELGKLMHWLGDALTEIESAAELEVSRRVPGTRADRETRLSMCAATTIDGGDPDAIEAFAHELLAHVEAERQGR